MSDTDEDLKEAWRRIHFIHNHPNETADLVGLCYTVRFLVEREMARLNKDIHERGL